MFENYTEETLGLMRGALDPKSQLFKAITTATNLTGYSLEAPAKKLYPVRTPLRNRIPRRVSPTGATAVNWKAVTGINTANVKASVAFGTRNSEISYATTPKSATYKSFGLDDSVQDEAVWMGRGFEDVRALSMLATLESVMMEEEKLLLGGNPGAADGGVALGTGGSPTLDVSTAGGCTGTFNVVIVPLTLYGYLSRTVVAGVTTAILTATEHGKQSAAISTGSISSNKIIATWTATAGAVAYAVYAGTTGNEKLQDVVTVNAWNSGTGALTTTGQLLSALTNSDVGADTEDFAGIIPQLFASGSGAYLVSKDNATLTADGAGGITEFDTLFKSLWDTWGIGPTLAMMNSQEAQNITKKVMGSGTSTSSAVQYRVNLTDGSKNITGSLFVSGIVNKFTSGARPGEPDTVPFLIHPYLPPGLVIFLSEQLPYPNANVSNVLEMDLLQEYAEFEWARTQRKYEHGVYANGVLKMYFPAGCGVLYNIANG